jgi:predicted DNA-binding protein (MmcQ/YjbR family)
MDQYELKARCLALPGAVEDLPFGDEISVFKVGPPPPASRRA